MVNHGALVYKKLAGCDFSGLSWPETEACEFLEVLFPSYTNHAGVEIV
jgi:hypothetical protein